MCIHWSLITATLVSLPILLTSCADKSTQSGNSIKVAKTNGFNPNHGPFDSNGNYRDEWADSPPRRVFVNSRHVDDTPVYTPKPEPVTPPVAYNPPVVRPPVSTYKRPSPPVVYKPSYTPTPVKPKPTYKKPTYKKPTYSKPAVVKPTLKPTPKPVITKVVPRQKPPILHTVRKGDTLYNLSQKYKSGVKTIQIANGLRDSNIQIGQQLKIPRF